MRSRIWLNWLGQYALSEVEDLGRSQDSESVQSENKTLGINANVLRQISNNKWSVNKQPTAMDNIKESVSIILIRIQKNIKKLFKAIIQI